MKRIMEAYDKMIRIPKRRKSIQHIGGVNI